MYWAYLAVHDVNMQMTEQSDSLHPWFCNGDRLFHNTAVTKVSVSNHRSSGEKVYIYIYIYIILFFFSKAEQRKARTTVALGPSSFALLSLIQI